MRLITPVLALLCASIPVVCLADAPAWLNLMGATFPVQVTALNFPDYQFLDSGHTMVWGEWTVSLNRSRPPAASLTAPCSQDDLKGSRATCAITIDGLRCQKLATIIPCTMLLEYAVWVDGYDCSLSAGNQNVSMRYCPEVQFVVAGKTIGPRSFQAVSGSHHRAARWVTVRNNTADAIEEILVEYNCCGSTSAMWAVLLSATAGDTPLGPGQERALRLPRSLIGSIPAKNPGMVERDQIDLTGQCLAQDVAVHLQTKSSGQPWSENLGGIDLCKTTTINVKS